MARIPITIGKEVINQMLSEIPLGKNEIGRILGLSKGGFWRVTHVSGNMEKKQWEKLKALYFSHTGKTEIPLAPTSTSLNSGSEVLRSFSTEELRDELERRGWEVRSKSLN